MNTSREQEENLSRVVSNYSKNMIRIAFTYVKNISDAEDIAQEVFLAFYTKRPKFVNGDHEKAWLIRVCVNKSKNLVKARWFKDRHPLLEDLSYLPEEENEALSAVLELEEKYRIPIHLHYYEGYSIKEIAGILRVKPATVGTWLSRGRSLLKEKLGGFGDDI